MPSRKILQNPAARLGSYVTRSVTGGESYQAFIPPALPPVPALDMADLYGLLDQATKSLTHIGALAKLLPDVNLFLYMYVRKEALVSSQIEGTQSSLSDLLLFESGEKASVPVEDVEEVTNYIAALNYGLARMKKGFPLSARLLREVHGVLLRGGRGSNKSPGDYRRSQNWIGGTRPGNARFVPPPHEMLDNLMSDLERFIHDDEQKLPLIIKAALAHVQFETIHPFLDGNGRLGRLLITLMLCDGGLLEEPILYLSLHFKEHRQHYYDLLQDVRLKGDWERWCAFFLEGVVGTSQKIEADAKRILALIEKDRSRIATIGRASASARKVHDYLLKKPYLLLSKAAKELKLSVPTITATVMKLSDLGIVKELTGHARNRIFVYPKYLVILTEGTKPLD